MDGENLDAVLLVHGTFAGNKEDEGSRWWQRGEATFWGWLNRRLAGVAACDERVFHWSGENKERERRQAGHTCWGGCGNMSGRAGPITWSDTAMAGRSSGRPCARRRGQRRGDRRGAAGPGIRRSSGLRSWTTVGTPFLTYGILWSDLLFLIPLAFAGYLLVDVLGQIRCVASHFGEMWYPSIVPAADREHLVRLGAMALPTLGLLLCLSYSLAASLLRRPEGRDAAAPLGRLSTWSTAIRVLGVLLAAFALFQVEGVASELGATWGGVRAETWSDRGGAGRPWSGLGHRHHRLPVLAVPRPGPGPRGDHLGQGRGRRSAGGTGIPRAGPLPVVARG